MKIQYLFHTAGIRMKIDALAFIAKNISKLESVVVVKGQIA